MDQLQDAELKVSKSLAECSFFGGKPSSGK